MGEAAQARPRAFSIGFRGLQTWSVAAQFAVNWNWSDEVIKPLASILRRRNEAALETLKPESMVTLLTIRFDGSIEPREPVRIKDVKGRLFRVYPGDVVFSKIDVRNGAIGLAPDEIDCMCVTSEFPVYSVNFKKTDSGYVKLLFRTIAFKKLLNSMISGASGRKRIQPNQLEGVKVPIPPLPIQQKIVAHWEAAQTKANDLLAQAEQLPEELEKQVLGTLGLKKKKKITMPKVMVTNWAELTKWNQRATYLLAQTPDLSKGIYPVVSGRECIAEVKHGCSASPSSKPTTLKVLKLSAVTSGQFLPSEAKFIADNKQFRENFDLRVGDILMCRTNGTLAYVGRPAILEKDYPELIFPDKLMRVRCKANVLPEYLEYILSSSIARPQLEANARTAVGNHAIGNEDVFNVELPLPPISEQKQLIKIVQEARSGSRHFREEAMSLKRKAEKEIEKMILGTRPVEAH